MIYTSTITKSGQITLPKPVREYIGVTPGQKVIIDYGKSNIIIKRKMSDADFFSKVDSLISDKTRSLFKAHAGKTVSELKSAYAASDQFKADYKEAYGL